MNRTINNMTLRRRGAITIALVVAIALGAVSITQSVGSASQQTSVDHPLVGAWVIDPEAADPANPPSFDAFMADGTLVNIGSDGASVGSWEATGPRTATMTFTGLVADGGGTAYFVIRGNLEVDESGDHLTGSHSFTLIGADGTVIASAEGAGARGTRIPSEPLDKGGAPLPGFPTWTPAAPAEGTPAA